jgi:hypothetical protein
LLEALLIAACLWGTYLALLSEVLSLLHALNTSGFAWGWLALASLLWGRAWRRGDLARLVSCPGTGWLQSMSGAEWLWLGLLGIELCLLFVTAVVSAPNNTDSLQYHLARVVHWQQDRSLAHYAASYGPQLWNGIWGEEVVLLSKVLLKADLGANLVQWSAMVGSLVVAAAISGQLGLSRRARWLAAMFLVSLPAGVLEATSTQTDYVAAFWMAVVAFFAVRLARQGLYRVEWIAASMAVGLAILTKGTSYLYLLPLLVWFLVEVVKRRGWLNSIKIGMGCAFVVAIINVGYWGRNIVTYGGPFGSGDWLNQRTYAAISPLAPIIGLSRQILLEYPTPSEDFNSHLIQLEHRWESFLGQPQSPFRLIWSWNHEDLAGSPFHMALALLSFLILFWIWWAHSDERSGHSLSARYGLVVLLSFVVFSWLRSFDVYGARQHLTFFALSAPLVGLVMSRTLPAKAQSALIGLFLALAVPWVLLNQTRPLVGWQPRTRSESVLVAPRDKVLFANVFQLRKPYMAAAQLVENSGCRSVGLFIDSHDPEYAWWWLLGAPESGVRIEIVDPLRATERYVDPSFKPCAMICTLCGDRESWRDLTLAGRFDDVSVFLQPSSVDSPDETSSSLQKPD